MALFRACLASARALPLSWRPSSSAICDGLSNASGKRLFDLFQLGAGSPSCQEGSNPPQLSLDVDAGVNISQVEVEHDEGAMGGEEAGCWNDGRNFAR